LAFPNKNLYSLYKAKHPDFTFADLVEWWIK
jgi:hypothetical protein